MHITLLGRPDCHLCDDAEALVRARGHRIEVVDIDADDDLVAEYGLRIPVLLGEDGTVLAEGRITEESLAHL